MENAQFAEREGEVRGPCRPTYQTVGTTKNEIEEKSLKLEKALKELGQAQDELVRQEKMATVGKLTQGLIDRILNPLNYINNFSHLTSGLLKDLYQNLESVKELLDEDTYLDSVDVINMMRDNLEKIEEHGSNTTRVLKAMEEILRDRNRQLEKTELIGLCRKDMELLSSYYQKEITAMHIAVRTSLPDNPLFIDGNAEQLGKTIMSLLNNGMYAIAKNTVRKPIRQRLAWHWKVRTDRQSFAYMTMEWGSSRVFWIKSSIRSLLPKQPERQQVSVCI